MRAILALAVTLLLWLGPAAAQSTVFTDDETGVRYTIERFLPANYPVGMAFAADGTLFYNEKNTGSVRMVTPDGTLNPTPVITLPTDGNVERGMLGIALDPDFENNQTMYIVHTKSATAQDWPANTLVRFRVEDGVAVDIEELLSVPITTGELIHNGGNVHFDADGSLYLSLGEYNNAANAQDLETMPGKIHRFEVTDEGLVPAEDNPYGNSIYALGLRNPFDFTFDPETNYLFSVDVGPTCDDELDLIFPGFNYGWREGYTCVGREPITGLENGFYYAPLLSFNPVEAPTGLVFYDNPAVPEWQGDLFLCNWIYGNLRRIELDDTRRQVVAVHDIDMGETQCRIDIEVGPDGALYFGTVGDFGGAIMRLVPESE
ncbi:MAG: PQQ-dependent sugar dehydrogenase [Anaerolineae bacterium]|nr:PQQ-dependent sugar dehydrogenase [Anaerolineae bacterium]